MQPIDPEVREFLARSMIVEVATCSRRGTPFLTPLWHVEDRGRFYMGTGRATPTARNIAAHPGVVLLFYAEGSRYADRVLQIKGSAQCHWRMPSWRQIVRLALKYYVSPGGLRCELSHANKWRLRQRMYAQGDPAVIEVVPEGAEFMPRVT